MVIIIVLKPDSSVNPGHRSKGQHELTQINIRIKIVIILVLKPDSGVDQGKAQVTGWEGQLKSMYE